MEKIQIQINKLPAYGGEKNYHIVQSKLLIKINQAITRQNYSNYLIEKHLNKNLTKEEFKKLHRKNKKYIPQMTYGFMIKRIKIAFGCWDQIPVYKIVDLCKTCTTSNNAYWTFNTVLKRERSKQVAP